MGKLISSTTLSDTLEVSECSDGIWLWDKTQQMNLSLRAKSVTDALVEAVHYYQRRLAIEKQEHTSLKAKVDSFLSQFPEDEGGFQ